MFGDIGGTIANKGSEFSDQNELYAPVQRHEVNSTNKALNNQWRALYEGIKRTNEVLRLLPGVEDLTPDEKTNVEGQAKFLRAWYHFSGRIIFKKFAYIDVDTDNKLISGEIRGVKNDREIFPDILSDAKFAWENTPELQAAVGRINKWNAGAFYGKVLLYNKDFARAREILMEVVEKGKNPLGVKYDLNASYADNFNADFDNSRESVFAFQASVNDNSGGNNSNWGDMLNVPPNAGGGAGFFTPTYYFTNHFKTNDDGLPLANPQNNFVFDPYLQNNLTRYNGNVDPRLDWTIGRNGIPYHDWGVVDHSWVRSDAGSTPPYSSGPYHPKKGTIRSSQVAGSHDVNVWFVSGGVSLNVNLIRFADILLMAAESEAEDPGGSLQKSWELVNRVRARAAATPRVKKYVNDANPSAGFSNEDAADYKVSVYPVVFNSKETAIRAIRLERLLELGMEGFRFFDLVRWGIAQQEVNAFFYYESTMPYSKILKSPTLAPPFQSPGDDYYPIPQSQIDLSNGFITP
jgi:starch-binding outer membrane protein, SusD/RagB family